MKRSAAPQRRTPLPPRASKPLKRTAIKKSTKPIRPTSRNRKAKQTDRDEVREQTFRRDGYRCRLGGIPGAGPCFGRLTFHHRRKDGQGGEYTVDNGATLCQGHNDELEADADLALLGRTLGLVLKRGDEWTVTHERFWSLVDRDGPIPEYRPDLGPCWIWRGASHDGPDDYGRFRIVTRKGGGGCEYVYPHRFALGCIEALVDGLEVDHLCRVLKCCNPRHLEQVTPAVNRQRQAAARPAPARCRKDLHDMTEANTFISRGTKGCRACKAASQADYYDRRMSAS